MNQAVAVVEPENDEAVQANEDMEAAFAASTDAPAVAKAEQPTDVLVVEEPETKPEVKPEATPSAPPSITEDQLKLLAAIPELEKRLTQQADKVAGNYGELKRLLDSMQKAAATPQGAAEFEASGDSDSLDEEFPELAGKLQARINKAIAKVPAGMNAEQLEQWYEGRKKADFDALVKILDTAHPDRIAVRESAEWKTWFATLPAYKQQQIVNTEDPYFLATTISEFKEIRDKQTTQAERSKSRIEKAVTPRGVNPANPSTVSEDEAAQAAFAAADS